jgi:hypothetical protein
VSLSRKFKLYTTLLLYVVTFERMTKLIRLLERLLINFGTKSLQHQRFVWSHDVSVKSDPQEEICVI